MPLTRVGPPYPLSDCNIFYPLLTPEQESLPWGKWKWNKEIKRYTRRCRVPKGKRHISRGMPFIPKLLFDKGIVITFQTAHRKGKG